MHVIRMHRNDGETVSGYQGGGRSPIGLGGAIAVHALAIGAFLLIPKEAITPFIPTRLVGTPIPLDPPPPEPTSPPSDPLVKTTPAPDKPTVVADPFVPLNPVDGGMTGSEGASAGDATGTGTGTVVTPAADPPAPAVFVDSAIDPRALPGFQPDYPGAMVRQGMEGTVKVRVTISAEGRVVDIERLSATDEAFWLATQRHALRKWRFRPATRDGVAVSSSKILTVQFKLEGR
ncbi:MAG: energy transducer TonB [bacterium]|nr:energy transducer TonB [bacterium]